MGLGFAIWVYVGLTMSGVGMDPPVVQAELTRAGCEHDREVFLKAAAVENASEMPAFKRAYAASPCQLIAGSYPRLVP